MHAAELPYIRTYLHTIKADLKGKLTCGQTSQVCTFKTALRTDRDEHRGYQLYESNPSGTYGGWKATAIGSNFHGAQNLLKQDYKEGLSLEEAIQLLMKARFLVYLGSNPKTFR